MSQFEGFFGQLSFQTSNFLGRGESLTVSLQVGSRSENYQVAFTEPFLFDRNITGGVDVYKRTLRYIDQFTQEATGGNLTTGFPLAGFSRMFVTYSYEAVKVSDLNPIYYAPELVQRNPYLRDSLLLGEGGRRTISKVTPSFVHNTVDNPIFPNSGTRLTGSIDFAGIGGNTNFIKPRVRIRALQAAQPPHVVRLPRADRIHPAVRVDDDPADHRNAVSRRRVHDPRLRHPLDRSARSGNGPRARRQQDDAVQRRVPDQHRRSGAPGAVLRHRPGPQHRPERSCGRKTSTSASIRACRRSSIRSPRRGSSTPNAPPPYLQKVGETNAFKASTGAEVRFFMPVLNVPFRLIFAYNPSRFGVLDNNLQPAKKFTFKFAVGSTF